MHLKLGGWNLFSGAFAVSFRGGKYEPELYSLFHVYSTVSWEVFCFYSQHPNSMVTCYMAQEREGSCFPKTKMQIDKGNLAIESSKKCTNKICIPILR